MRRRGTPEELAKAMPLLAVDDSSYCLRAELLADGGLTQLMDPDFLNNRKQPMAELRHQIPINATPEKVFAALATQFAAPPIGDWLGSRRDGSLDDRQTVLDS
jgi:hypothetical protein